MCVGVHVVHPNLRGLDQVRRQDRREVPDGRDSRREDKDSSAKLQYDVHNAQ